ncbi:hypothetical protein P4S73_17540 [Paraglaciecola sp. Hal342]
MKNHFFLSSVVVVFPVVVMLTGCGEDASDVAFKEPLPDVVDFNYHVKPILSDTCYLCHGPGCNQRKSRLELIKL